MSTVLPYSAEEKSLAYAIAHEFYEKIAVGLFCKHPEIVYIVPRGFGEISVLGIFISSSIKLPNFFLFNGCRIYIKTFLHNWHNMDGCYVRWDSRF